MKKTLLVSIFVLIKALFPLPVAGQGEGDTTKIEAPSTWLPAINVPGILSGNIDFVTCNVIPFIISVLVFLIIVGSLIMLIVGGIMWTTSGGDKEGMAKAKGAVTYAIVGLILGLSSFLILNTVMNFLGISYDGCNSGLDRVVSIGED